MCPWLLRKLPRPSLICTKFLGKKLQFNLDCFRFSKFHRFQFCRGSLAEHFVTYFLVVISLQKFFGKNFLFRYFLEEVSLQSLFGRELLFCDFPRTFPCSEFLVAIFLQIFSVHTFSSEFLFE